MCSTPKTSSRPRRHTSGYTPGFKANHHYWNRLIAEREKQLSARQQLHQQHVADFQRHMKKAPSSRLEQQPLLSRLFGFLRVSFR